MSEDWFSEQQAIAAKRAAHDEMGEHDPLPIAAIRTALRAVNPFEWRTMESAPIDGTTILRPHVIWGAMAVRHKRPDQSEAFLIGYSWMNADYAQMWPEEAFLPWWMPTPKIPPAPEGE